MNSTRLHQHISPSVFMKCMYYWTNISYRLQMHFEQWLIPILIAERVNVSGSLVIKNCIPVRCSRWRIKSFFFRAKCWHPHNCSSKPYRDPNGAALRRQAHEYYLNGTSPAGKLFCPIFCTVQILLDLDKTYSITYSKNIQHIHKTCTVISSIMLDFISYKSG